MLRSQINDFLLLHPDLYLSSFVLTTISEWAHENRIEMGRSIDKFDNPLLLYTKIMQDATPGKCEYRSFLEAFEFVKIKRSTFLFIKRQVYIPHNGMEAYQ